MHRFAHISDIHLGSQRDRFMREKERESFDLAMDKCREIKVDFILISGDLFHNNVPALSVLNDALSKLSEVTSAGIPVYMVYGSHDFSHDTVGAIDILETAGVITNVSASEQKPFVRDGKTGALLSGVSGRKAGLEKDEFAALNREVLESADGFKIFLFHSAISEFKPADLSDMESIEISYFPTGMDYYAGGHIHRRGEFEFPGYGRIVFPGPLYLGWQPEDISRIYRGEKRGFYVVDFDDEVRNVKFVDLPPFPGTEVKVNLTGKNAVESNLLLIDEIEKADLAGRALLLKVYGRLSGGKTSDIDFVGVRKRAADRGALYFSLDRFGLDSEEMVRYRVSGDSVSEIERNVIRENAGNFRTSMEELKGERGISLASSLLQVLRADRLEEETEGTYNSRILQEALKALNMETGGVS